MYSKLLAIVMVIIGVVCAIAPTLAHRVFNCELYTFKRYHIRIIGIIFIVIALCISCTF